MSQPATLVRRATQKDLPAIGELGALLVRTHYAFDPQRFMRPKGNVAAGYASFLGTQLEQSDVIVLVAEREGGVVGYAYAGLEPPDWMSLRESAGVLYDVVVDPANRGQGIGRLLLEAAVEFLRSRGAPRVVLSAAERNQEAQRLFASAGFRRTMIEMTREL